MSPTPAQIDAVNAVAKAYEWNELSTYDLGLLLYCLFHYYVQRL